MNYEEKYNEILEWARKNKARLNGVHIEEVLPELRESEDESTRKALIETVKCIYDGDTMFLSEQQRDRYLDWLEKQKEPVVDKEGMYYYLGGKFIYCGYPATGENPYDFAMSQLEKQKEQKPSWSEEDEKIIGRIRSVVNECASYNDALDVNGDYCEGDYAKLDSWLKSLKPQPKQEWSVEDERMLKCCLIAINHYEKTCNIGDHLPTKFYIDGYLASVDKVKSWLKSLRPQYHGDVTMTEAYKMGKEAGEASHRKPSEEQMKFLLMLADSFERVGGTSNAKTLREFHEQLKKL